MSINTLYIPASRSVVRKILWLIVPKWMWMTYRLPFQKAVRVTYPVKVVDPYAKKYDRIRSHEFIHAQMCAKWWGPWVTPILASIFPLPIIFSGRWYLERRAYLADIRSAHHTVDSAVNILWRHYWWPWPKPLMRRWFIRELLKVNKL